MSAVFFSYISYKEFLYLKTKYNTIDKRKRSKDLVVSQIYQNFWFRKDAAICDIGYCIQILFSFKSKK